MDEAMKRRLVGVLVIVAVVFVISLLLPHPGTVQTDENNQRVTLDLTAKEPEPVHTTMTPVPPVIAAAPVKEEPKTAATPGNDSPPPQIEEPPVASSNTPPESMTDDEPPPSKPQKPADVAPAKPVAPSAKPKTETVVAAKTADKPAKTEAPTDAKPKLKLEDSIKQKAAAAEPAKPVEKVAPKVVTKTPAPPAKAVAAAPTKPAAPAGSKKHWYVQVGAFNDIGKARQVLDKLSPKGLKGIISPLESAKGTLYRTRIGPLASRDLAKQAQDKAATLGFASSSVIED